MTDDPRQSKQKHTSQFRLLSDEILHSWHAFQLLTRTVESPSGTVFDRTFLDSPGAVGALAIDGHNNVVLVQQYRATLDGMLWEIPAGMRDIPGEDPLLTAQRELAEEAGYVANEWEYLGQLTAAAGVTNSVVHLYVARELRTVPVEPDGPEEEHMAITLVPFHEALQMVIDGRITDSKSMIALLLAAQKL